MATIKSYTTIEQSKKLAKILSLKSSDMYWYLATKGNPKAMFNEGHNEYGDFELPCWSLAALLNVLPKIDNYRAEIRRENNCFCCAYTQKDNNGDLYWYYADNPVDACYNMILKLNESNLL